MFRRGEWGGAVAGMGGVWRGPMIKFVLRGISVLTSLAVAMTVALFLQFVRTGRIGALLSIGVFGVLTLAGWILTVLVGPFAALQLWRLRPSGRRATAFLAACATIYYALGLLFYRGPGTKVAVVVFMVTCSAATLAFLLSGPARVLCHEASPHPVNGA